MSTHVMGLLLLTCPGSAQARCSGCNMLLQKTLRLVLPLGIGEWYNYLYY